MMAQTISLFAVLITEEPFRLVSIYSLLYFCQCLNVPVEYLASLFKQLLSLNTGLLLFYHPIANIAVNTIELSYIHCILGTNSYKWNSEVWRYK